MGEADGCETKTEVSGGARTSTLIATEDEFALLHTCSWDHSMKRNLHLGGEKEYTNPRLPMALASWAGEPTVGDYFLVPTSPSLSAGPDFGSGEGSFALLHCAL